MIEGLTIGALVDPLSGRTRHPQEIRHELVCRLAYYQSLGMKAGDSVFLHYGNTVEFFIDLLAVWRLGACAIPLDPHLTPFEVETVARTARPRFSLWDGSPDRQVSSPLAGMDIIVAESPAWSSPGRVPAFDYRSLSGSVTLDQNALILFTSGTTHQPKGVVHSHRSLQARWMSLRFALGDTGFSRTLCLLPTQFGHGLICNCLFPWLMGQDLCILPAFKADLLMQLGTLIDQYGITCLSSVPAMWRLALKTARPPQSRSLQRVFCGSAPLSASLWTGIQQWSGTNQVVNAYGITETASWLAGTTLPEVVPADGLVGEIWGGTVKILKSGSTAHPPGNAEECPRGESGHIWVNTPALMKGYLGREDLTTQVVSHGWFVTGDIGFLDDGGFLHLSGREREEINKGGMKVHPTDIDMVVERFEHTVDVCAFAYEDALQGEDIGIAVVLEPNTTETRRGLYEWTLQHLGGHRVPRRWYVVDEIPRSSRGKVNRASIAQSCALLKPSDVRSRSVPAVGGVRDQA
ncbi:MAG: class I adenylate-forming enzyme family protein [Acidobacteriota bacterium]